MWGCGDVEEVKSVENLVSSLRLRHGTGIWCRAAPEEQKAGKVRKIFGQHYYLTEKSGNKQQQKTPKDRTAPRQVPDLHPGQNTGRGFFVGGQTAQRGGRQRPRQVIQGHDFPRPQRRSNGGQALQIGRRGGPRRPKRQIDLQKTHVPRLFWQKKGPLPCPTSPKNLCPALQHRALFSLFQAQHAHGQVPNPRRPQFGQLDVPRHPRLLAALFGQERHIQPAQKMAGLRTGQQRGHAPRQIPVGGPKIHSAVPFDF